MSNNSNIITTKDEKNETIVNSLDKLYEFLFEALCNGDIFYAIEHAKKLGVSGADISIVIRRLLENYDDLAKVNNLRKKGILYLVILTGNAEFATKLHETIAKFFRERICKKDFKPFELENPKEKVLYELYCSNFYRKDLGEITLQCHDTRISEACKKKQASDYDEIIRIILEVTNNKDVQKLLENTIGLLFNNWYGENIFGKPTPREISIATDFLGHPGIKKYVMRNYKDFLQSSWNWYGTTEWSELISHESDYASPYSPIINCYLELKGWTINEEGELISLTDNKPVKLGIKFPSAINMRETHDWLRAYRAAERNIKRLILDEWDQDIFGGKQPQIWQVKQIISDTIHPGIMRYALKKYQKELIDGNLYDSLSEDVARIENNPENYEHLINLYDTVLDDNNINLNALSERLGTQIHKQH